jgi:hypothetical protein
MSKALRQKQLFPASQLHHFQRLGVIEGDGFFHKHMLACVEASVTPS